jgi:hypothetical protein
MRIVNLVFVVLSLADPRLCLDGSLAKLGAIYILFILLILDFAFMQIGQFALFRDPWGYWP